MRGPGVLRRYAVPVVLLVLAVVVNLVVFVGMLQPARDARASADARWRTERDLIARYKTYQQSYQDATAIMERAVSRNDLPQLVTTLAALAKKRGLSIPAVNYQPERFESKDFHKVGLTFGLSGTYPAIRRFLDDLERSSPFLAIEDLTLRRGKANGAGLDVDLRVAAYLKAM